MAPAHAMKLSPNPSMAQSRTTLRRRCSFVCASTTYLWTSRRAFSGLCCEMRGAQVGCS